MNLHQLENAIRAKRMMSEAPASKEPKVGDDVTYVNAKGQTKRAFVSKILTTKKDYLRLEKKYLEAIKFIEVELKIIDENKIIETIL